MKSALIHFLLLTGVLLLGSTRLRADEEQDLIAILHSPAGIPEKCAACFKLKIVGTAKCVPTLAGLLHQDRVSHAARNALESMPIPEAGAALRAALGKSTGLLQAGLIDSLGWRGEPEAVPLLTPLLSAADATIAAAAAAALGRIGGNDAITALSAARDQAPPSVQPTVWESLLKCAERRLAAGNHAGATAIYQDLFQDKYPTRIRVAAWRGLILADAHRRRALMIQALSGADHPTQMAATKLIRELHDKPLIRACAQQWASLPADSQLAVLEAQLKLGAEALPTVHAAMQSPHLPLRVAAWTALADLHDPSSIPALTRAAAHGEPAEQAAAQDTLSRVRGPGMRDALLAHLDRAEPLEKAALLRALGDRGDASATPVLLEHARTGAEPARRAALNSLTTLAVEATIAPLLDLAAQSKSDAERQPVLKALYAVCQGSRDKAQTSRSVVAAIGRFAPPERRLVLPLLAELGTADALAAAQAATQDQDIELAKEAVRVLAQWPNAGPCAHLLRLARAGANPTVRVLALRAGITVAGLEPDLTKRLQTLKEAMAIARQPNEKKQALGQMGRIPNADALAVAMKEITNPDLVNEASLAAVSIAGKLAEANPQLANEVAAKVLAHCQAPDIVSRAWALRIKPKSGGPFIQDWLVSGPYSKPGAVGALTVFNLAFGPEKTGAKVQWRAVPRGDHVQLAGLFPGQENCVAYLKTQIIAPADLHGALLMGSDDGIQAWLNGEVVHSNNIDRPEVVDQDMAPIHLRKGENELLLKISQGAGGWSASARIVGMDGLPIRGLRVKRQHAPPVTASVPKPSPTPKPAELPPRDTYHTLRLSDQFYAEGAYYGDFNRDGTMDVVAGPFWFAGPDFQPRHEYRPAQAFDPKNYSDNFLTYTGDFNGDGWTDILCVPFPGKAGYWYENPAGKAGHWKQHLAYDKVGNESPVWGDLTGDGRPELIFCNEGYLGYAGPNPNRPDQPWVFHAISTKDNRYQRFTHGVGFGDLNGDRRPDVVEAVGWWEQPVRIQPDQPWLFHPFRFAEAGAQMLVEDVNGDGLADLITAWHCHHYGLVWWEQIKRAGDGTDWKRHVILSPTPDVSTTNFRPSQMHALALVDLNGDGLKDILTGKRFWAHGPQGDKEPNAPAVIFWLELRRDAKGNVSFIPHLLDADSGVGTQVAATDLNGDARPDVVVANKKGIFVHLSQSPAKP